MKKTLTLLGITGILGVAFYITTGEAESPSPATQTTSASTQVLVDNEEVVKESNRLEGALLLAEALNIQPIEPTVYFEDVPDEHQGIINVLVSSDIVGSITEDFFGADEPMTRGETAIWINNGFQLPVIEESNYSFTDVNELCTQDIANVVGNGIMEPAADTTFGMGETVTLDMLALYLEEATN